MRSAVGLVVLVLGCSSGGSSGSGGGAGAAGVGGSAGGGSGGVGGGAGASGAGGSAGAAGTAGGSGNPVVEIDTSMGMLAIELDPVRMPVTTENFLAYVDAGFYSGTIIHRVIPDFVIQGGGYGPGFAPKATNPPIQLETHPEVTHVYGAISMARTTDPNSATTQFFVVNGQNGAHGLDGDYAAFGIMIEGSAVLDAISQVPTTSTGGFDDVPVDDVVVNSVTRR